MTNLFADTKVKVYVMPNSKNVFNAFTIPGEQPTMADLKKTEIFLISLISSAFKNYQKYKTQADLTKLEYIPETGKLRMGIKNVTLFVTGGMIDKLSYDEIIAICLHEVGHNTRLGLASLEQFFLIPEEIERLLFFPLLLVEYHNPSIRILGNLILISLISLYISCYFRLKSEVYADEFAIKCGYGDALASGLNKLIIYSESEYKKTQSNEILKKISETLIKIFTTIFKQYPTDEERMTSIYAKTALYDISKNNTDRSADIDPTGSANYRPY